MPIKNVLREKLELQIKKNINLKLRIHIFFLAMLLMVYKQVCGQQDPLFTQYMFNTQVINPAYAGIWGRSGVNLLVRKQWAGLDRSPLTQAVSVFSPLKNDLIGLGLTVSNDQFGFEKRLGIFGDYVYEIAFTDVVRLRMGLKFGFMNYQNPLSQFKLYPDGKYDPVYTEDIEIRFLPNFGAGLFLYGDNYYVGFSVPKMVKNNLNANYNNYTKIGETTHFYLTGGYVFKLNPMLHFKPTAMLRATPGAPFQFDLGANFLFYEKLWVGPMFRSGDAMCAIVQWVFNNNLRLGFAMDFSYSRLYKYQLGTYEFTMSYDLDHFSRANNNPKYF